MSNLTELFRLAIQALVDDVMRETAASNQSNSVPRIGPVDEATLAQIAEYQRLSHKPYLTRREVATYLDVSKRSITEWTGRASDHNPFPASAAGGEPRYRRERIDEWAEREAQRKRLKLGS